LALSGNRSSQRIYARNNSNKIEKGYRRWMKIEGRGLLKNIVTSSNEKLDIIIYRWNFRGLLYLTIVELSQYMQLLQIYEMLKSLSTTD